MKRPTDHVFGGHREIVKRLRNPLIDADESLLSFGETAKVAQKAYPAAIRLGCRELGRDVQPESEGLGIWLRADRDLAPDDTGPYVDVLGRSKKLRTWRRCDAWLLFYLNTPLASAMPCERPTRTNKPERSCPATRFPSGLTTVPPRRPNR